MRTALLILATGAATFAAGWFLKPSETIEVTAAARRGAAKAATLRPLEAKHFRQVLAPAASTGTAVLEPFRSGDEVLELAEGLVEDDALETMDKMAFIELIEALPRLMVTDISAVRSMLEEVAAAQKIPKVRMMASGLLAFGWILQDPEAATGYVLANPALHGEKQPSQPAGGAPGFDEETTETLAWIGIALTARKNPAAAKTMLEQLPDRGADVWTGMLTMREARTDPARFLTTSSKETIEEMGDFTPIIARWAKQDPQAALRWTQTLEDPDDDAWIAIAEGWADKDRAAATAWASSLTDPDHRRGALGAIALKSIEGLDAAAADAALAAFPPEVAAQARLEWLSSGDHNPTAVAAMVQDILLQYSSDSEIMEVASGPAALVVQEFVKGENGPAQAVTWLATLPEGPAKIRAVSMLIDHWAEDDPAAASAWIQALPAGDTRESATLQLISEIRSDDPAGALEWARSISTEGTRREQVHSIFRGWLPEEPHKAMEALQQLPAEEQAAMFRE